MMSKIKKYIPEIVVSIIILGLIFSNLSMYFKSKYEKDRIVSVTDSLLVKIRNDSSAIDILNTANVNCINSTISKIEYYEKKIRSTNKIIQSNQLTIDRLEQYKNNIDQQIKQIDSTKRDRNYLLNFINKKY